MSEKTFILRFRRVAVLAVVVTIFEQKAIGQSGINSSPITNAVIQVIEGRAEIQRAGAAASVPAQVNDVLNVGDQILVQQQSRVALTVTNNSVIRLGPTSVFQIHPPQAATPKRGRLELLKGILHFFHRGPPTDPELIYRGVSAAVLGTEFNMAVVDDRVIITVFDGEVLLSNASGSTALQNLQEGVALPGIAPVPRNITPIEAINALQWTLYYPGILDLDELTLDNATQQALQNSLNAYRAGNLLAAIGFYPAGRIPQSGAETIYRAALLLAVGQVEAAQALLDTLPQAAAGQASTDQRLAAALRRVILAINLQPAAALQNPELATELLAVSYYQQSLAHLPEARNAARAAAAKSGRFGFALERVAELELSFGGIDAASDALDQALALSPENAQAVALKGFLLAAQNRIGAAIERFNEAIALDGGLANAWLGRGLSRIRSNKSAAGREDLLVAAALEPQRALFRSYLGKAFTDAGKKNLASEEIARAKELDSRDPTGWLYSALLKQQNNEINDAIRELERAQDLNDNRAIYRSQFKLDEDRAVRSANLAHIYRDAGMRDWSVLEAGRAVSADYANYSAHLFLANSYDELRDPNRIHLRYETVAESEYLIANLLAPVGAGTLSQTISQQEYSKLFERNRLGFVSSTEYLSRGAWYQNGAQFGTFGNSSYALEGVYRTDPGQRANNDFEELELRLHLKQQLTPKDTIYLRAVYYDSEGGDRFQYYNPAGANLALRTEENQEPAITLGYHHEWNPNSHLLFTAARFDDTYEVTEPNAFLFTKNLFTPDLFEVGTYFADVATRTRLELYSTEIQQLWQTHKQTTIVGGRYQSSDSEIKVLRFVPIGAFDNPPPPPTVTPHFERWSIYAYHTWRPIDALSLIGGVSYDDLRVPENFRSVPMSDNEENIERLSPKAGVVWTPTTNTTLRTAYTRSLAGASLDQSIRIEPTQIAGFNQAFRSIVPESIAGANAAARFETYDLSLEHRIGRGTYLAVGGEVLFSDITRHDGALSQIFYEFPFPPPTPSTVKDIIAYRERSLLVSADQLIGRDWVVGGSYRLTEGSFAQRLPEIDTPGFIPATQNLESTLHRLDIRLSYNSPKGFFTRFEGLWNSQSNKGYSTDLPGDEFCQFNLFAGYRFAQRRAQVTIGILNVTDQNYQLNPLVLYNELPRERTFVARFNFNF